MSEQNGTLRQYLDKQSVPLELVEQTTLIHQLVFGLSYLHEHRVAHRDFKSLNVLLDGRWFTMVANGMLACIKSYVCLLS